MAHLASLSTILLFSLSPERFRPGKNTRMNPKHFWQLERNETMSDLRDAGNEIDRMWQEAELYEAQGLYDHAKLVYQSILGREPDNREAQVKIVQVQFTQRMEDTTASRRSPEDLSPRLALDLGIAYMGMDLFEEALDEFRKARGAPSPTGIEVSRLEATCLIHLGKFDEAKEVLDRLLGEDLEPTEKADIIGEAVGYCLDEGALGMARKLLSQANEEERKFIEDYDVIFQALSARPADEDTRPKPAVPARKEIIPDVRQSPAQAQAPGKGVPDADADTSLPLRARVTYSFDNRNWAEGLCVRLASEWAHVQLAEPAMAGETLIVRIHLPKAGKDEQVWVVSKVSPERSGTQHPEDNGVRVNFVSFLPGGESALQSFLKEVANNPSAAPKLPDEGEDNVLAEEKLYAQLEERALKALQEAFLPEPQEEIADDLDRRATEKTNIAQSPSRKDSGQIATARSDKIRFACQCGQVHEVPGSRVGRKGTCSQCGTKMIVPVVDPKPDSLADELLGKTVGGCRLLYKIGGGGMGGVFKAHHLGLDIPVAVKILHAHLATRDPVFVKRFIREARATAKTPAPQCGRRDERRRRGFHLLYHHALHGRGKRCRPADQGGDAPGREGTRYCSRHHAGIESRGGAPDAPPRHQAGQYPPDRERRGETRGPRFGEKLL